MTALRIDDMVLVVRNITVGEDRLKMRMIDVLATREYLEKLSDLRIRSLQGLT